jgi:hypothetical protein
VEQGRQVSGPDDIEIGQAVVEGAEVVQDRVVVLVPHIKIMAVDARGDRGRKRDMGWKNHRPSCSESTRQALKSVVRHSTRSPNPISSDAAAAKPGIAGFSSSSPHPDIAHTVIGEGTLPAEFLIPFIAGQR